MTTHRKSVIALLVALALGTAGTALADPAGPSDAERQRIERIVREYLLSHPEVLTEAMQSLNDKRAREAAAHAQEVMARRAAEIFSDPDSPVTGNPRGDVTIVEFLDLRCPVCKRVYPAGKTLLADDPNIRKVYKLWPILGPDSVFAARMALAARAQEGFERFVDAMMTHPGRTGVDEIVAIAGRLGLDVARLRRDMAAPAIDQALGRNFALAEELGLTGTPSYIVGNTLVSGGRDLESMKALVARARDR